MVELWLKIVQIVAHVRPLKDIQQSRVTFHTMPTPAKACMIFSEMTYYVSSGTLNHTH